MPLSGENSSRMFKLNVKNNRKWNRLFEEPVSRNTEPSRVANEIMKKDIFNENELKKMTPDYCPSDLVLRMELRSSMVRDSHTHAAIQKTNFKSKSQRQRNIKDISRVSREIAKIKHNLNNKNIKNNLMLKHSGANMKKPARNESIGKTETTFLDSEISFMSELENSLNSEREILSEIDESFEQDIPKRVEEKNANNITGVDCKNVNNSDDIEDLQTALTLMTIYSNGDDKSSISNKESNLKDLNRTHENNEQELVTETLKLLPMPIDNEDVNFLKIFSLSNIAKQQYLANKYFSIWRQCAINKKGMSELRKQTLNNFFERLMKEKCELKKANGQNGEKKPTSKAQILAQDQTSYQHRYQVQKNIIALQKLKLEEQNRVIEELKYNRIVEASKESAETMRDVVRNAYSDMDRRMKPKIKCLTNELKLHDIEEPALVLHCLKVPQFLQRMERRAREREEKHALIRERRRQMEEERLRLKQQAELAKAEMDKEEKAKRISELKEKRRQEKIENIRRKQHAERMRAFRVMADLHYEKNLLWRFGIRPWIKLIEMKRENVAKALDHYDFQVKKNTFLHWLWYTEDMSMERNFKAEDCYRKKLLRKTFDALKLNHRTLVLQQQVADDYYELYVQQLVFRKFRENVALLRSERHVKWLAAVRYYESNLMFRTLTHWRVLPALNKLQRERDARKTRWRQKVLQVVPDYKPPDDD